jgi:hypothetical protein
MTIPDIPAAALTVYLLTGLAFAAVATFGEDAQTLIRRDG